MTVEWRPAPGYPEYEISGEGKIRRTIISRCCRFPPGYVLTGHVERRGYQNYNLTRDGKAKRVSAHRIICEAYHGAPPTPKHHAAHWNGDRLDNRPVNLRWATATENCEDKSRHGRKLTGERMPLAKLTWAKVADIRQASTGAYGEVRAFSREYGVSATVISHVLQGRIWKVAA